MSSLLDNLQEVLPKEFADVLTSAQSLTEVLRRVALVHRGRSIAL